MGAESEDDFGNLFADLDLTSQTRKIWSRQNELIVKVLCISMKLILIWKIQMWCSGRCLRIYLIGQFASGAGKKAGEFYTPQQVSSVLAQIVTAGKDQLKSDPTCGSGSLLLRVAKVKNVSALVRDDTPHNTCVAWTWLCTMCITSVSISRTKTP
jgi:type I restriction enzyme M protein